MVLILSTTLLLAIPLIAVIWRFGVSLAKSQALWDPRIALGSPHSHLAVIKPGARLTGEFDCDERMAFRFQLSDGLCDHFIPYETDQELFGLKHLQSHVRISNSWERNPRTFRFTFAPGSPLKISLSWGLTG